MAIFFANARIVRIGTRLNFGSGAMSEDRFRFLCAFADFIAKDYNERRAKPPATFDVVNLRAWLNRFFVYGRIFTPE
jgi:hypothetical protein